VSPSPTTRRLLRVKDLIDARYAEPLDLRTLARHAGTSSAHFSRQFNQAFGEAPHQYLRSRRLERAAALLRSTDQSVLEICRIVGLRSVGSFTTSFGRAFGVSPAAYRSSHQRDVSDAAIPLCEVRRVARPRARVT
jgi:AraC-like DNA-binding protein